MKNKTNKLDLSTALSAAACALLGSNSQAGWLDHDLGGDDWDAQAALMYYGESDGRVSAVSPVFQFTRTLDTDEFQTFRITLDTLTGASPTGAVPSNNAQTFTGASGNNDYTVAAQQAPLDNEFKDSRIALNASWERPLSDDYTYTVGGNFSNEYDYISLGANASIARYLNQKNTTLSLGLSFANDTISAVGGTPLAFAALQPARDGNGNGDDNNLENTKLGSDETKTVTDVIFGITQVIDRDSVLQLTFGLSQSDGYQNDPYKILSVVDNNGDPVIADTANNLSLALHENRPDSRSRQSIFAQYKRNFNGSVLDTSYRYMQDNWDVRSHTLEASYRMPVGNGGWLQPRLRLYTQEAADFYVPFFVNGEQPTSGDTNTYASSDYRLGEMSATTIGLTYGREASRPWHATLEYYQQSPTEPANKFGALTNLTLTPEMKAFIVRFNIDL